MKRLYEKYINDIQNAINKSQLSARVSNFSGESFEKGISNEIQPLEPKTGMEDLARLMGIKEIKTPYMGDHPDFKHLRDKGGVDYHYIVSMFIDVKNSTNFHKKYDLNQIALIIQTIVAAATHTCALFDGHIQRLQYDGVFVYFGGKNVKQEDAVKSAINAASFFSFFIRYELREIFQLEDIDNIYTRIGIDLGHDQEVQWVIFGTEGCSELTTNSLHTSLATKMQSCADSNGIVIGDNVRKKIDQLEIYCDFFRDKDGNVDPTKRYIFEDQNKGFKYGQQKFKWQNYLTKFHFIKKNSENGNLYIDYNSDTEKKDNRVEDLYKSVQILKNGNASFSPQKGLNDKGTGVKVQEHNFHCNDKAQNI